MDRMKEVIGCATGGSERRDARQAHAAGRRIYRTPFLVPAVRTTSAPQAYEDVLRYAGCIVPRRYSVAARSRAWLHASS